MERGSLSLAELAAAAGLSDAMARRVVADFEFAGIVERVGGGWRLTAAAIERFCEPIASIRSGNVPLEEGDDDGLDHCKPGPRPTRPARGVRAA